MMANQGAISPEAVSAFVEGLQANGMYTFSKEDVRDALPVSEIAVENALRRLKKRGRIVAPRRGFYVVVPTEYKAAGSPPPPWFIDDLMRFLDQPYYVGLLSAAAVHGASHQQPITFQVITDRPTREGVAGRAHIAFHMNRLVAETPASRVETETGTMRVSTPEATAFDLVRFSSACGGWSNVATALLELAERLEPEALCSVAKLRKTPEIQRLGYLLDLVGQPRLTDPLVRALSAQRYRPVALAPDAPRSGAYVVTPWRVIVNVEVEIDL